MEATDAPELGPALLRWVNALKLSKSVSSWRDLRDGEILWELLASIEPDYFTGELPEPINQASDNWIPRWQNLKHIDRLVMMYIRDECGELPELSKRMTPDLKAIAIDAAPDQAVQLLKAILLAAMYSPVSNQRMVKVMEKLGPKVSMQIAACIGQMEMLDKKLAEEPQDVLSDVDGTSHTESRIGSPLPREPVREPAGVRDVAAGAAGADPELEREERLIQAFAEIKELEEKNAALHASLQQNAEQISGLEDDLAEARYRLEQKGHLAADNEVVMELQERAKRSEDYIAELESELESLRAAAESQERQLERLQADTEAKQKLRDEMQLLRVERDELLQKAKASDNLRKKIQTLQDSDRVNQNLRADFDASQEEIQSMRGFKDRCTALQKANEENMKTIANGEQEIFDQKTTRKRLDHELKVTLQRLETLKEKKARDEETIHEQEERIRDLEAGHADKDSEAPETLDEELIYQDRSANEMKRRLAQLEAELAKPQEPQASVSDDEAALVQQKQQMLEARAEKMERQYLELYQENLGLQSSLNDDEKDVEHSRPFLDLRDRLTAETAKSAAAEKRLVEAEKDMSDRAVRLQSAESKLSVLDKGKADALEELKQSVSSETNILQLENSRLLEHIRNYQSDLDGQTSLLRHALLDPSALLKEDAAPRASNEFKLVQAHLAPLLDDASTADPVARRLTKRIEDARADVLKSDRDAAALHAHEATIKDLQLRLKRAEQQPAPPPPSDPVHANMHRELALMTTAWYDMATRMQSDAVVIHRRSDGPKSFLNRQRKLLNDPRPLGR